MHLIDWAIVVVPLLVVIAVAVKTQRYVKSVADFMTAGRAAGRYLVCNAVGEASFGAISVIALFQVWQQAGFTMSWWSQLSAPVGLFVTLTGFVIYRYRQSRCMTLAQFFEARYSRNFRVFMGIMAWISGLLNYAVFPIVGARFFVYYCGFTEHFELAGIGFRTEAVVMFMLLGTALAFTLAGGQLTAMVVDCVEGLISGVMYLIIAIGLLYLFSWREIHEAMALRPEGQSMLNPFDTKHVKDFNVWYVAVGIVGTLYNTMAWQGGHAFKASAASPHEAKMGNILGRWREYSKTVMVALLAVCAYTFMTHADYAGGAAQVTEALGKISDEGVRKQMHIPVALSYLLPLGLKGVFAAVMLFALISTDSSYLHSWGSIFAQDVVLPFRKTPMTPKKHIWLIRWCIVFVAVFAYCYGLWFVQKTEILLYFAVTGAIFLGGAGSAILGGFYWKKGTTQGAFAGMITGSTLAVSGVIIQHHWESFPINGQWMYFIAMVSAITMYVTVSLLTCKQDFDLDRILHRGKWAVDEQGNPLPEVAKPPRSWKGLLGIDEQFTFADKCQSVALFFWIMLWFTIFVVFTAWNLISPWPEERWAGYWRVVGIFLPLLIGSISIVWFTIGGVRDLRSLFVRLKSAHHDERDDGTVGRSPAKPAEKQSIDA